LRWVKNLSVKQLSQAGQVTYEMARRYTLGTAKPRDEKLIRIAEWLNVPPAWLDYGGDEKTFLQPSQFSPDR
jgi:transcriptional regulator with XRE-family HTH domain